MTCKYYDCNSDEDLLIKRLYEEFTPKANALIQSEQDSLVGEVLLDFIKMLRLESIDTEDRHYKEDLIMERIIKMTATGHPSASKIATLYSDYIEKSEDITRWYA